VQVRFSFLSSSRRNGRVMAAATGLVAQLVTASKSRMACATGQSKSPGPLVELVIRLGPGMAGSWFAWALAPQMGAFRRNPVALMLRDEANDVRT
jgi:hypothetical protein